MANVKIYEYDLRLYGVLKRGLTGDYVSPAIDALTPAMRAGLLQSLPDVQVGERHACSDDICRSFRTTLDPVAGERLFRVRFLINGELIITCNARGTLFNVQWLPGEATKPIQRCYVAAGDGFEIRPHVD